MKIKSYILAGCMAILLSTITFVACDLKDKNQEETINGETIVDPETGEEYYSIIGTWKNSYYDSYYGQHTEVIVFNADHTGTFTIYHQGNQTVYSIKYNYDQKKREGDMIMIYKEDGNTYTYPMDFKLKWYGKDTFVAYTRMSEGNYEDEWSLMGTYERQGKSDNGGSSQTNTNPLIGSWRSQLYGGEEVLILQFKSDYTGWYIVEEDGEVEEKLPMRYEYTPSTGIGSVVISIPYYETTENVVMDFKTQWYGSDAFYLYFKGVTDDEWGQIGLFERI